MAKQESIIKFTGTIDGINFYYRKGVPVARKAGGGFNGDTIKKSPTMIRVRENGSEFGNCSKVKKVFNDSTKLLFGTRHDITLHNRLMRLFLDIKDCDLVSERGKRSVGLGLQTVEGKHLLTSFAFTVMPFPVLTMNYSTTDYQLDITALVGSTKKQPKTTTHLELCLGIMVLDFDVLTSTLFKSEKVIVPKDSTAAITLTPTETPVGNGLYLPVLFYGYLQEVNGVFYQSMETDCFGMQVLGF